MSLVLQPSLPYPNGCQGTSPHQQGRDTKMSEAYTVGIDVSMDRLDVAILPGGQRLFVANDAAGWAELGVRLQRCAIAAIGLEPSGAYERGVVRALLAAGFAMSDDPAVRSPILRSTNTRAWLHYWPRFFEAFMKRRLQHSSSNSLRSGSSGCSAGQHLLFAARRQKIAF